MEPTSCKMDKTHVTHTNVNSDYVRQYFDVRNYAFLCNFMHDLTISKRDYFVLTSKY